VCCGTEREVTIDCPSDCPHLAASRKHDYERRNFDRSQLPFPDTKLTTAFVTAHAKLLLELSYKICLYARDNSALVDSDVMAALESLVEAYRTLASGILYENPPAYRMQRELYELVKATIEKYRREERGEMVLTDARNLHNGEMRDILVYLTRLGAVRSNGRPKGRAYLDFLRNHFRPEALTKPASGILMLG
jgi:hypothetical protein